MGWLLVVPLALLPRPSVVTDLKNATCVMLADVVKMLAVVRRAAVAGQAGLAGQYRWAILQL